MEPSSSVARNLNSRPRHLATASVAGIVFILFSVLISRPLENFVQDFLMSSYSPFVEPDSGIVLVTINEQTLEQFSYRTPVDRGFLADLIQKLDQLQPKVIGLDLLFDQPTEEQKDSALQTALQNARVPIVIASTGATVGLSKQQLLYHSTFANTVERGEASLMRDPIDGVVRRLSGGDQRSGNPSFGEALVKAVSGRTGRSGDLLVYYRNEHAEPNVFTRYPAHTLPLIPRAWIKNKIVIVGVDLPTEDRHPTPFALLNGVNVGNLPGVVIHAHIISQLLNGDRVIELGLAVSFLIFAIGFLCSIWLIWKPVGTQTRLIMAVSTLLLIWVLAVGLFRIWGISMQLALPSIWMISAYSAVGFLAWRRDNEAKNFLRTAFSVYVNPNVVDALVENPERLKLGGETVQITSIFTDLEGFTEFSEEMPPDKVGSILNEYLSSVLKLFTEHGATIDKIVGDSVVGFFGAPVSQDDQAERAARLALAIDRFSEEFRKFRATKGVHLGITRIGIHSGPALVGNFGGQRFFDYTAIGDTVNTAARLEGINKYIGTRISVSENVIRECQSIQFRKSGTLTLKGRNKPISVYEILHPDSAEGMYAAEYRTAYDKMQTNDPSAVDLFAALKRSHPQDRLIAYHADRLAAGLTGDQIQFEAK